MGNVTMAFIRGDYALGTDSGLIDLVIVGSDINFSEVERVRKKTEHLIDRKIAILILDNEEFRNLKSNLMNKSYLVLLDKAK
jgi:hypothetical protein